MSIYLSTSGMSKLSIAICDRCKMKYPWAALMRDPNYPGLRVCAGCVDELDPYRLPARQTETITMSWVRPDASLATDPSGLITEDGNSFLITEDGNGFLIP